MQFRKSALLPVLGAVLSMALASAAHASPYSAIIVYGDSLSDNGNIYAASGGMVPLSPPYFNGRFSDGPVTVEQLAALDGVPLVDFAWGGAMTGVGNIGDGGTETTLGGFGLPGMLSELAGYPLPPAPGVVPNALFIVWGGANDFGVGTAVEAATNIDFIVATLESEGAQHILVPGLPDLGQTPAFSGNPTLQAAATAYSESFNSLLEATLPAGARYFDTFSLLTAITNHPGNYGLSNVTAPCFNGVTVCADPSQYLFWDAEGHPTTAADSILAAQFAAVPEPGTLLLLGSGLAGLAVKLRRRRVA